MSKDYVQVLFPVGRFVAGSIDKGRQVEKNDVPQIDAEGKPILEWSFGCAIAKVPGQDWKDSPWGQQLLDVAKRDWPQGQWQQGTFSWKITDGDSTIPNRNQKIPAEREGYPGHWVVFFSSRYPCKTVNAKGSQPVPAEAIKPGHYIQVLGSVKGNDGQSPGLYLNHDFVAHAAFGPEISMAQQDASQVGFGTGPLPVGATATPQGQMAAPGAPTPPQPPAAAAPVPTVPYTGAMDVPPVPAGPKFRLTELAASKGCTTVEALLAAPGWSEALALQHGYIIAA